MRDEWQYAGVNMAKEFEHRHKRPQRDTEPMIVGCVYALLLILLVHYVLRFAF